MNTPWEILGLSPGFTQSDLKQAYARLLKLHRPDKDPEGFRRVRDAYEFLREYPGLWPANANDESPQAEKLIDASTRVTPVTETAPPAERPPEAGGTPEGATTGAPVNDAPSAPPPSNEKLELVQPKDGTYRMRKPFIVRLIRKLKSARRERKRKLEKRLLKTLLKCWRMKKTQSDVWDRLVLRQLSRKRAPILKLVQPDDALVDVRRDGTVVAVAMLRIFSQRGGWPTVLNILDAMKKELEQRPSPAAAAVAVFGARQIALLEWKRAQEISNLTFPHLTPYSREVLLPELDRFIQAGREISTMVTKDRASIARGLANGNNDPADEDIRTAIRNASFITNAPTAKTCLRERFPEFKDRLRPTKPSTQGRVPVSQSSSSSGFSGWWAVWIVIMVLSRAGSCSKDYGSGYSSPPPARYQMSDEERARINEIVKKHMEKRKGNEPFQADEFMKDMKVLRENKSKPPVNNRLEPLPDTK